MATRPGKPKTPEGILCVVRLPCCRCLDGTATEIPIDTGTAAWRVTPPGALYQQAAVPIPPVQGAWADLLGPAVWIGAPGAPETEGDYEFELQFYVPDCVIPAQIYVSGRAAADNRADIFLDSNTSPAGHVLGYDNANIAAFTVGPVSGPGIHRLRFVVTNDGGPTGLIVHGAILVRCPRQLEHGPAGEATAAGGPIDPT